MKLSTLNVHLQLHPKTPLPHGSLVCEAVRLTSLSSLTLIHLSHLCILITSGPAFWGLWTLGRAVL